MQKEILYNCFEDTAALNELCVKDLEALLIKAPYFQPGWMLLAKAKNKMGSADYNKVLSQTAARVYDREQLFDFIYLTPQPEVAHPKKEVLKKAASIIEDAPVEKVKEKVALKPKQSKSTKPTKKVVSIDKPEKPKPIHNDKGEEVKSKEDLRTVVKERLAAIDQEKKTKAQQRTVEKGGAKKGVIKKETVQKEQTETIDENSSVKSNSEIIETFIKQSPSISKPQDAAYKEEIEVAARSLDEKFDFISETLAEINLAQGHKQKAIKIYQKLSLKYPEKSSYFAAQIKKIKS